MAGSFQCWRPDACPGENILTHLDLGLNTQLLDRRLRRLKH